MNTRPQEDNFTTTVEAALGHAKQLSLDESHNEDYPDFDPDTEEEDPDYCGCSDPCCPCDGFKSGTP